eukprot:NODE_7319_length_447_cov_7.800000_g7153_i0.p2 GENE.NODE_7319_length_447_cov_7.800000_g7153_i0~~NODE_7319_length_447_cov_7.800000_g7153_i0.p2  ORF type:complete len:127 (+),score=62.82 NODE_7319_length_447_cov_7.800000_g7153_i0:38-382(+)
MTETQKQYLKDIDAPQFFDKMLTKLLVVQPDDVLAFVKQFVRDSKKGEEMPIEGQYSPKLAEDTVYVKRHRVTEMINALLEDLLRELPQDPLEFYLTWLDNYTPPPEGDPTSSE